MKKTLQKVDQLVKWDYSDEQGTYTGLIVISQKAVQRGLKTTANITIDPASKSLPMRKIQELSRLVQSQFAARKLLEPRSLSRSS